ncbi:MAG: thioester domain-containing protein, partial [Oscillospiraceae bacterium]|nr:thioester domain-containing protein [Oscillospiraceae bacterium]
MNRFRRLLYISLCLLLTLSLFSNVYGAESSPGEQATYVLNHRVDGDDYNGPDIQYFSPYRLACTLDRKNITMKNCLFSLYNTVADEVIPAYCSDITVLANPNYAYRRMNLEDSTFSAGAAGQIRSIVVNGFYIMPIKGESDEAHAARVARELERLGDAAGVVDLTIGEAISGTQSAIWQAAHGTGMVYKDFLHSMYMEDVSDSVKYYDMCNEERYNGHVDYNGIENGNAKITTASDREVGGRIQTVYNYLMAQEPMAPMESIVSPASFREISGPFAADNADGTFDLTVTVTVNVRMEEGDALTLSASLADTYHTSAPLQNGSQTLTLKLNDVPSELIKEKVLLEIQGLQSGYDVYLFDSVGDRETSQSMVGMVD